MSENDKKIWSGRFTKETESVMVRYSYSIDFDKKLFDADIQVNKAWAQALAKVGVYNPDEVKKVLKALDLIQQEFKANQLEFSNTDEDIHSANERWLTERLGELGARIHTGRSRNDQVVTDYRVFLRNEISELGQAIRSLQKVIIELAENNIETVLPGFTHLRQAQPISFAHYLLALFFQVQRDYERLEQAYSRCNKMPLGSGALAGAAFSVDREELAKTLGFDEPSENSIDATSDRDFVLELAFICSQVMLHLSRIAEDFIIYSSEGFRFIEIDQAYSTGSSMMPQKRNPDSLELLRGKTARVIGNQTTLMTLLKGIPTAYARDLQEDKQPLFDSFEQTIDSIMVLQGVIQTLKLNKSKMVESMDPALYATDVADYLVKKGIPFRKAHSIVGHIVTKAEEKNVTLADLALNDFREFSDQFEKDVLKLFDPIEAITKRNLAGGTGPESIKKQLKKAHHLTGEK